MKTLALVMIVLASAFGCSDDSVGSGISGEAPISPFGPPYGFATTALPGVAHSVGLSMTITPPNGYAAIVWEIGI